MKIVIAGQTFDVVAKTREQMGKDRHGTIDGVTQDITYADDLAFETVRETIMHEVLHGLRMALSLPRREKEVAALALQLVDTLRRNPTLVSWLMEERNAAEEG